MKRWMILIVSLFIMSFGVAFSVKAQLGTSPISSFPNAVSEFTPFTIGNVTIFMHVVLILLQILILRKKYELIQLIQLPLAIVFGYLTDLCVWITQHITYHNYVQQWIICLIGIALVAIGVSGAVTSKTTVLAGEGFCLAVCKVTNMKFGNMKMIFDISLVVIAVAVSLIFTHHVIGVREGTVAAMVLVGLLSRIMLKPLQKIENRFVATVL
ncbi:MAG: DUF6198 family protein [Eubacterium sp.]|nr:DUF6198 family protein [Eubacterium sp.]